MVGRTPGDKLSKKAQTKLISLLVTLLNRPEPNLRLIILHRCYLLPVQNREQALLPQLLKALNSDYPDEVAAAANAIFATYRNAELIAETIKQIIPNRRSLDIAIASLQSRLSWYGQEYLPIVKAILAVLATDPLTIILQTKLAIASLPWDELTQFFIAINNRGELHADALFLATQTLNYISRNRNRDIEEINYLETTLAASEDEKLRRIALSALIAQTNSRLGWNQERVNRLLAYRQDQSALVATAAQFTFSPDTIN
jgi:sensor histidine kinase YesM